jgi:hypothetical protein
MKKINGPLEAGCLVMPNSLENNVSLYCREWSKISDKVGGGYNGRGPNLGGGGG